MHLSLETRTYLVKKDNDLLKGKLKQSNNWPCFDTFNYFVSYLDTLTFKDEWGDLGTYCGEIKRGQAFGEGIWKQNEGKYTVTGTWLNNMKHGYCE